MELGNISDSNTQVTGPQDSANPAMYATAAISGPKPTALAWNWKPSVIMATPITMPPMISSGLRPSRSTVRIATTVKTTFATPTMTVCNSAESVEAPRFLNISGA